MSAKKRDIPVIIPVEGELRSLGAGGGRNLFGAVETKETEKGN